MEIYTAGQLLLIGLEGQKLAPSNICFQIRSVQIAAIPSKIKTEIKLAKLLFVAFLPKIDFGWWGWSAWVKMASKYGFEALSHEKLPYKKSRCYFLYIQKA